ncbi:MAG: hypothetical protein NC902_07250 [Candidatus Omnitrophica bacterium]|nr:hypothetical protein [Candidatus Omnitrophota bacterium]
MAEWTKASASKADVPSRAPQAEIQCISGFQGSEVKTMRASIAIPAGGRPEPQWEARAPNPALRLRKRPNLLLLLLV